MRFQVLGAVTAHSERGPIDLGAARQRTVLAVLLVEPGSPVSIDQLVDRVWGQAPPQRVRRTLQSYLSRLRRLFSDAGGPVLTTRGESYALEVDRSAVDMHRFRALASEARSLTDDDRAATLWRDALALWRGAPFTDLDSEWLQGVAVGLEAERWSATLDHIDLRLRQGEHARLLSQLTTAASEHPWDERLAGQLMLTLYRCGRQGDALACYRSLHARLVEEVGSVPGADVQELHQRILRQDPELTPAPERAPERAPAAERAAAPATPAARPTAEPALPDDGASVGPRPAQLPADVSGFTGRAAELAQLDALVGEAAGDQTAVVITAIGGTAGVGKTALAVHWAHRVASDFPDGQLYVNLRGYDPEQPMLPADALAGFLTALGVAGSSIPVDVDERAARFRSELAGRRMLVVLDNAASVAQVRPLLPGSASCVVVVTSRDSLAGLVTVQGARRLALDQLPAGEAVGLLRRLVRSRVDAEPESAAVLAEQCARLPLALRIAAELAAARPDTSLAELVSELGDRQGRLAYLDAGGDPYSAIRQVFSWSIQHLPAETVRLFRLLGLHPGPDLDAYAVAALAGTDPTQARQVLELLVRAHLVHRTGHGRYGMHDLLRAYAAHLATTEDTQPQRQAAEDRLLDFYQAAAMSAMDTLHPAESHYRPEVASSITAIPPLADHAAARAWLAAELHSLVAVAAHAAGRDQAGYTVGLARILHRYLGEAHISEMVTINEYALGAAERAGDLAGQAHALRGLGMAHHRLARYALALDEYERALTQFQEAGDRVGEALTLTSRGITHHRQGNHKQAIEDHLAGIDLARHAGDRLGEAFALNNLAVVEDRTGNYAEAADHYWQALVTFAQLGARFAEGVTLSNVANVELRQGRCAEAAEHLRQSQAILEHFGGSIAEAHTLDNLGSLHLHRGEPEPAIAYFQQALDRYRRTGERTGQAWSINGLGEAAQLAGRLTDAMAHHTEALAIATEIGTRHQQARAHAGLGHVHRDLGETASARTQYELAHTIYTELDMPEAEEMRVALARLAPAGDAPSAAPTAP